MAQTSLRTGNCEAVRTLWPWTSYSGCPGQDCHAQSCLWWGNCSIRRDTTVFWKKKTRGTEAKPGGIYWCTSVVMVPAFRVYRLLVVKPNIKTIITIVDDIVRRRICRRLRLGNNLSTISSHSSRISWPPRSQDVILNLARAFKIYDFDLQKFKNPPYLHCEFSDFSDVPSGR